ncbi:alpha/beta hydrolase [Nocardia abscessus]|uniref:alpha/beta hydrolase n=1 Tax=Nocardia abscessus TaxID=120957 RepID=UPI002455E74F|nr:alpha/beta hydrolase [Nocardia abscessus]
MSAEGTGLLREHGTVETVVTRSVEVDGMTMSALCAEVEDPRAVLVAVHGGATSARYFDVPGRPWLSLLRLGARLGFTVLAVDRPGYGASEPWGEVFESPQRRVDACYATIDALLETSGRGAGVFLAGHSAGCDLAARMAADDRGGELLGLELAGTGVHKHPEATRVIEEMRHTRKAGGIRDLLWSPQDIYPPEVFGGRSLTAGSPGYEVAVVRDWPTDFPVLASRVRVPVRLTHAEYERVWRGDPAALADVEGFFTATPRFVVHQQARSGHNLSVGFGAAAYHLGLLSFVEECALRSNHLETRS